MDQSTIEAGLTLAGVLCMALPVVAAVAWHRRTGAPYLPFLYGTIVFIVFQLVLRVPWQVPLALWAMKHPGLQVGFLAFSACTAGLFEEVGRYIGYRVFLKDDHRNSTAVMYGLGHGGIESILLVGVSLVGTAVMMVLVGRGIIKNPEIAMKLLVATQSSTVVGFIAPVVERISALAAHVGFALLVLQAVVRRRMWWVAWAILAHAVVDFIVPGLAQVLHVNVVIVEGVNLVLSIAVLYAAVRIAYRRQSAPA